MCRSTSFWRALSQGARRLIHPGQSMGKAKPGQFATSATPRQAADLSHGRPSTSHLAVVDGNGNAVSMTTSVEGPFGSH